MDDWQEAALSNRHLHNRRGQNVRGKGKKGAAFDVHRTFGTYELKCPAAEKLVKGSGDNGRLEIYCLNETQNALYGELVFPGLLNAVTILAGSRRVMNTVLRELIDEQEEETTDQAPPAKPDDENENGDVQDDEDDEDGELETQRAKEFEKNSFRSPKFWLRWQGELLHLPIDAGETQKPVTDSGYLVFSGNTCDKFEGTISCESLEWDNVKLRGWKESTKSARNFDMMWYKNEE